MSNTNPLLRPVVVPEVSQRKGAFGPGKTQILYVTPPPPSSTPPPPSSTPPHPAPSPASTLPLSAPPPVSREQLYAAPSPGSTLPLSAPRHATPASGNTMMFGSVLPSPPRSDAGVITRFLPVEQLLSRAVEARAAAPVAAQPPVPASFPRFPEMAAPSHADIPLRVGPLARLLRGFRAMSAVSRMSVAMLVLLGVLLAAGRVMKRTASAAPAARPSAAATAPHPSAASGTPRSGALPLVPPAGPLPSGLERRAADALAEGRDEAALALYRDLAARAPQQPAFREAVRLLERRKRDVAE